MGVVAPVVVGPDERPDQHHGSPRRADEGSERGADGQDGRVDAGRAVQVPTDHDAAGDREEGEEQQHEGDVFEQHDVKHRVERDGAAMDQRQRHQGERHPEGGDGRHPALPEMVGDLRQERDREQDPGEGDDPGEADRASVEARRERGLGENEKRRKEKGRTGRREADAGRNMELHAIPLGFLVSSSRPAWRALPRRGAAGRRGL